MEEEIQDVATDTNVEEKEGANTNEPVEVTVDAEKEELRKAKAQLTARAKKAEEELKTLKAKPQENNQTNDPQLSDELKLIARGLSDEAIEQAKVIAKGKNITLTQATKDPLFEIYQKDEADKKKREDAKLGASKGSGGSKEDGPEFKSGMTREEHQEAWKKYAGK